MKNFDLKLGELSLSEVSLSVRVRTSIVEAMLSWRNEIHCMNFSLSVTHEEIMGWANMKFRQIYIEFIHLCDLGYVMDGEDWVKITPDHRIDVTEVETGWEVRKMRLRPEKKIQFEEFFMKVYEGKTVLEAILAFEREEMSLDTLVMETDRARDLLLGGDE